MLLEKYFNGAKDKSYAEWITGVKSTEDFLLSWSDWLLPERSEKIKIKFNNLKKILELERAVQVKFISYTVKYSSTKKDEKLNVQTFENPDFLESRKEAVELVKMLKQTGSNYKGIQLILNYL